MIYNASTRPFVKDLIIHTRILIRVATRYLPTPIDWHFEVCKVLAESAKNSVPYVRALYEQGKKALPNLMHLCPHENKFGVENADISDIIEKSIPQVIPRATYKLEVRAYRRSDNETLGSYWSTTDVEAVAAIDNFNAF